MAGNYLVTVTNAFGAITSAPALLAVDYGASTSNTVTLIGLTNQFWRYNQSVAFFNLGGNTEPGRAARPAPGGMVERRAPNSPLRAGVSRGGSAPQALATGTGNFRPY